MALIAQKPLSDECRWICIYPAYMNAKKSLAEGRRIPADLAVDNPTCQEIFDILKAAGLNAKIEKKMYPREWVRDPQHQGRVRVQLKNDDGSPVNADLPNRHAVLVHIAKMIPLLKTRQGTKPTGASSTSVPVVSQVVSNTAPAQSLPNKQKKKKNR